MKIKNATEAVKTWCGQEIAAAGTYTLQPGEAHRWAGDADFVAAIFTGDAQVLDAGDAVVSPALHALNALEGIIAMVDVAAVPPFAEPLFRTKLDGVASPVTVQPNNQANIDFPLTAERWVYGGEGLVLEAQPGDWFEAQVVDANGVIPEAYRAALCEASPGWPVVSTYVPRHWVMVPGGGQNAIFRINTYPLIAKVTAGLVLRTVYHAANVGNARTVYANLFATVKL